MRVLKVESPFKGYQAFRLESETLTFTAYEKDYGRRFVVETTFDDIAPFHRIIVPARRNEQNLSDPEIKWDTILDDDLKIDSMSVRPKKGNLYQRLEASYEGVNLYFRLMKEPENESLQKEMVILRISQGLSHALERFTFNQNEYHTAQATHESSLRTLKTLEETYENFVEKMEKEKKEPTLDNQKMDYLTERLYFYQTKIKRTKRRIERAEKRAMKAKEDVSRAKNRVDLLQKKLKKFGKISPKTPEIKPILTEIKKATSFTTPVLKKESKKKEDLKPEVKQVEKKIEKTSNSDGGKIDLRPYILVMIALLLAILGWLIMTRPLPTHQTVQQTQKCLAPEKEIIYVQKIVHIPVETTVIGDIEKTEEVFDEHPIFEKIEETESIHIEEIIEEDPPIFEETNELTPEKTNDTHLSELDKTRNAYIKGVLNNQKKAPYNFERILSDGKNYLTASEAHAQDIEESLVAMNELWNAFRRASLKHYYKGDKSLKVKTLNDKVENKIYIDDEILLYQYSKRYQKMFKNIATKFLNSEAGQNCNFKGQIQKQLKTLGRPETKLNLLKQMRQVSLR
ncbi:MAG: hypothetical protein ACTSXV_02480 [Alphaproteobacteria bacterium]